MILLMVSPTTPTGYVESLMRQNYEAVGFIPRPKLEEYARRGQVLMETENDEPCGYLVFGAAAWPYLRVYQSVIQYDARRREHGFALVRQLMGVARQRGAAAISLWCADDLEANEFWRAAGFRFAGQRQGGAWRGRKHNRWLLPLAPGLFGE